MQQSKEVKFFSPERTAFPIKSDIIHSIFRESAFDMRPLGSDVGEAEAQLRTLHDEDAVIVSQSERRGESFCSRKSCCGRITGGGGGVVLVHTRSIR